MSIEIINPTNKEHWLKCRALDITSTEVSALFGISPYMTEFELWHNKKNGNIVSIEENERMKWGNALQDAIANEIAKEQNWNVRRMNEYIRNTSIRAGSSFDFSIEPEGTWKVGDLPTDDPKTPGLLEIKNVDSLQFKNGWIEDEDGNLEAPLHIEIQVQHQLMVSGRTFAYIGALVGGNNLKLIKREYNPVIGNKIREKIIIFWESIASNTPPSPDFNKDAEFISKLYGFAEPNKTVDMSTNQKFISLATEHTALGKQAKEIEEKRDALKAEMLTMIGDAEKVIGDGFTISAGIIGECPISYVRKAYRMFRASWRKQE